MFEREGRLAYLFNLGRPSSVMTGGRKKELPIGRKSPEMAEVHMKGKVFLHAMGIWFVFFIFAFLNGTIRNIFLEPTLGEYPAHVIAATALSGFVLVVTYIFVTQVRVPFSKLDFLLVGFLWVIATVIFEFAFGHYIMGNPWETLLADYNILEGRLWPVILACELFGPLIFSLVKRTAKQSTG